MRTLILLTALAWSSVASAQDFSLLFDEDRLLEQIAQDAPGRYESLVEIRGKNRNDYYKHLHWTWAALYVEQNDQIRDGNQAVWELTVLLKDLGHEYQELPVSERASLRREMSDIAGELNDARRSVIKLRLTELDQRIIALHGQLEKMDTHEERRIEGMVKRSLKVARR